MTNFFCFVFLKTVFLKIETKRIQIQMQLDMLLFISQTHILHKMLLRLIIIDQFQDIQKISSKKKKKNNFFIIFIFLFISFLRFFFFVKKRLNWGQKSANKNLSDASTTLTKANVLQTTQTQTQQSKGGVESQGVFVGDLAPEVTQQYLQSVFQYFYPSVYNSRVVTDPKTNRPKGLLKKKKN